MEIQENSIQINFLFLKLRIAYRQSWEAVLIVFMVLVFTFLILKMGYVDIDLIEWLIRQGIIV